VCWNGIKFFSSFSTSLSSSWVLKVRKILDRRLFLHLVPYNAGVYMSICTLGEISLIDLDLTEIMTSYVGLLANNDKDQGDLYLLL
jgi:hypothetical protein